MTESNLADDLKELDDLIELMPGDRAINGKNTIAMEKTILELKRLRLKNLVFEDEDEKEYLIMIDRLLWVVGKE